MNDGPALSSASFGANPVPPACLLMGQAATLRRLAERRRGRSGLGAPRTFAFASAARGMGKTTLAANLAVDLQRRGRRVVVIDAAPGDSGVAALLGAGPRGTFAGVVRGERSAREAAASASCGVRVVAAVPGIEELPNLTPWQQERLWRSFAELEQDCDLVLVDTVGGDTPESLSALAAAGEVLLVAVPGPEAAAETYALAKAVSQLRPAAAVHLVMNRTGPRAEAALVARRVADTARRFLGVEVETLGFVPDDPHVAAAEVAGEPFVAAHPRCQAARCVAAIADRLCGPATASPRASLAQCLRGLSAIAALDAGVRSAVLRS